MLANEVIEEFRKGFHRHRLGAWIHSPVFETTSTTPDVAERLSELAGGSRDFSYPGHDARVFSILQEVVSARGLKRGADIGCETGAFPAMQLHAGINEVTVFEVRDTHVDHPRVRVRVQDLTYADDVRPEFDLVTCLSTIEHIGLGRYGDPIDPWGDIKMAANLKRLLTPGGIMLISFPVGRGTVVFNQHRIYSAYRRDLLFEGFEILGVWSDRSPARRVLHEVRKLRRGDQSRQPIWMLRTR